MQKYIRFTDVDRAVWGNTWTNISDDRFDVTLTKDWVDLHGENFLCGMGTRWESPRRGIDIQNYREYI